MKIAKIKTLGLICFLLGTNFLLAQCNFTVNAGPDLYVCHSGDMGNLNGKIMGSPIEFYWTPATNLSNPKILTPKVTVYGPETYVLVARGNDNVELILNGDFSAGNTGFTTDYTLGFMSCYGAGFLDCEGTYGILTNPQLGHVGFAPCKDHTSGSGNMMVLNGAAGLQNVWCQNVTVMPDMDYTLSAWITSVVSSSPAILQFYMNGSPIGPVFNASPTTCDWQNFKTVFNVGSNTNIELCIINLNMATGGNDFAIDDISLKKICEVRDTVEVNFIDPKAIIETPDVVTCDNPIITLDGSGSSNGPGWTFKWTANPGKIISGDKTLKPRIEGPGIYKLEVCSPIANCCETVSIEVMGNIIPPIIKASTKDTLGCGVDFAFINLKTNIVDVQYFWTGPGGFKSEDQNLKVNKPGTYIVTVVDNYNCKSIDSVKVIEKPENPKVTIDYQDLNCKRDSSNLFSQSTIAGSSFLWKAPNGSSQTGDRWSVRDTGRYILVTTTPGGCIRNDTFHIKEENKRKGIATNITSMFCLNDQTRDTAYLLTEIELPGDVFTVTGPGKVIKVDSINFKLLVAGRYKIEVLGANGCIDSSFFNVLDNRIFPKVTATTDTINCRTNMATLTGFSSDTSILSYWKNSKGDKFNSDLLKTDQAGIYTFISTNRYGCSDSTSIKVLVDTNQTTYQVFDDTLTCLKPKTTLVAIGDSINKKYSWTGPNNFTSNLLNPEINSSGQYVLQIESPNYCVSEHKINILEDKIIPKIIAQNGMLSCLVDSIQLQAQLKDHNGIFYWKDQFGNVFNPLNPFIKSAGIYTLFASNKNGCSDSLQITIDKDVRKPDLSINLDTLNCTKRQITINALSTFDSLSYKWTGPNGINSNLDKINIISGGKYTIRITTNQNCFSEQSFEILEDTIKPILNIQSDTLDCLTTEIDLNFSSSVNIQLQNWMGPNNFNSNLAKIKINSGGIYTLTATADNFCTSQIQVNIIQDTIRPDLITNLDSLNCLKTEIDLKAISNTNPITFEWTLTDKMKVNSANIKTSVPGIYKIKATGSNHCSNEQEIIIPIDTLYPMVTINNDFINCIKKQAILNSTTQSNIIKYSWSGPNQFSGNKSSETVNSAGIYMLTVESPNGCQSSKIAIVDIDTIAPKAQVKFDSIDCLRKEASITVLGSLPKYTFIWNNNSGQIASNTLNWKTQKGGQYFLQLSDTINGCITIIPANIVEDSLIIVDLNMQQIFPVCGKDNGEINNFKVIGGHGDYIYSLTPNGVYTKQTKFTNLNPGSYELYVKDQQGCEFSKKFDILDIPFVVTELPPELNLEIGELKTLNLNINLPTSMIRTISWTPKVGLSCTDCTNPTINPTKDQEYMVTVIDTNGCESTSRIRIIVIKPKAWVPNVFSPNGDLTNDWFYVQASKTESLKINHFQIFDRWGNKVFQTNDIIPNHPEQGWNGNYKSENCNPGVFIYWVELENLLGEKFILSGDVTLLR